MKYIATILICGLCMSVLADSEPVITPYIELPPVDTNATEMLNSLITETIKVIQDEGWTATDVADAIRSLRGLYLRDNATKEGRARWHGKVISTSVDTNTLIRTTIHEDGEVFEDTANIITPKDSAQAQLAKLPRRAITNGVPVSLANARQRQIDNSIITNIVTIKLYPDGN